MRAIQVSEITKNIKEMCIEANHFLTEDMDKALKNACACEKSELGKQVLNQLQENLQIAGEDMIPICQDTGMAVIFVEIAGLMLVGLQFLLAFPCCSVELFADLITTSIDFPLLLG